MMASLAQIVGIDEDQDEYMISPMTTLVEGLKQGFEEEGHEITSEEAEAPVSYTHLTLPTSPKV